MACEYSFKVAGAAQSPLTKRVNMSVSFTENHARLTRSMHHAAKHLGGGESAIVLLQMFLYVAECEGKGEPTDVQAFIDLTGLSSAAVSRNVGLLSGWGNRSREGLNLIEVSPDLLDRRKKRLRLSTKGKRLLEAL